MNPKKAADIPSVPNAIDYAKTNEARQLIESGVHAPSAVLRAYALPPGTPKERVNLLRRSFMDTMKDAEFAAEIKKADLDLNPLTGAEALPARCRDGHEAEGDFGAKKMSRLPESFIRAKLPYSL